MTTNVARAAVEAGEDGSLVVSWELEAPAPVHVAVGSSPEPSSHRVVAEVPAGTTTARLEGLAPGLRHYVSVAPLGGSPLVVAERRIRFAGPANFRDIGGYLTASGRRTAWGVLFRSDGLHRFTPDDLRTFESLGTRRVFDLRGEAERRLEPSPVPSAHVPLLDWYTDETALSLLRAVTASEGEKVLYRVYAAILQNCAPLLGGLFGSLAGQGGLPAVVHCAAGKDRTGLVAALLLELVGVERETVLDDYELSARWGGKGAEPVLAALVSAGAGRAAAEAFLGAPRWAMAAALEDLDRSYGGAGAYLAGPGSMPGEVEESLRISLTSSRWAAG